MNEFKEYNPHTESIVPEQVKDADRIGPQGTDIPGLRDNNELISSPLNDTTDAFSEVFKRFGLVDDPSEQTDTDISDLSSDNTVSQFLEKGADGRYYDKETGRSYDSIEDWIKAQETLAKRYESTAEYFKAKADKEWARFKNSENNGESDAEKWEHYRKSQEYYSKSKECQEKAAEIRARLSMIPFDSSSDEKNLDTKEKNGLVDAVPPERKKAVQELYDNAPDKIKDAVQEYGVKTKIESTSGDDPSHYDRREKIIRMEDNLDNDEYAEILSHEYGHCYDQQKGDISQKSAFKEAVSKDMGKYDKSNPEGESAFNSMLDELMNSDAAYDRAISDNLSAYFQNDTAVIRRYWDEGAPYYCHPNGYWQIEGNIECELFANCFSMYSQNNADSCDFMARYFPNTWEQFLNSLN